MLPGMMPLDPHMAGVFLSKAGKDSGAYNAGAEGLSSCRGLGQSPKKHVN